MYKPHARHSGEPGCRCDDCHAQRALRSGLREYRLALAEGAPERLAVSRAVVTFNRVLVNFHQRHADRRELDWFVREMTDQVEADRVAMMAEDLGLVDPPRFLTPAPIIHR